MSYKNLYCYTVLKISPMFHHHLFFSVICIWPQFRELRNSNCSVQGKNANISILLWQPCIRLWIDEDQWGGPSTLLQGETQRSRIAGHGTGLVSFHPIIVWESKLDFWGLLWQFWIVNYNVGVRGGSKWTLQCSACHQRRQRRSLTLHPWASMSSKKMYFLGY